MFIYLSYCLHSDKNKKKICQKYKHITWKLSLLYIFLKDYILLDSEQKSVKVCFINITPLPRHKITGLASQLLWKEIVVKCMPLAFYNKWATLKFAVLSHNIKPQVLQTQKKLWYTECRNVPQSSLLNSISILFYFTFHRIYSIV